MAAACAPRDSSSYSEFSLLQGHPLHHPQRLCQRLLLDQQSVIHPHPPLHHLHLHLHLYLRLPQRLRMRLCQHQLRCASYSDCPLFASV